MKYKLSTAFGTNVLTVMTGTGLAQIFPVLISPILTRIYTPEDFGVLAIYLLGLSLLTILATGKYENALYLAKNYKAVSRILDLSLTLSIIFSVFLMGLVVVFGHLFWAYFHIKHSILWLFILPVALFISSHYVVLTQLAIRTANYKQLSISRVCQSLTFGLVALAIGYLSLSFGLVVATFFGQFVAYSIIKKTGKHKYKFKNLFRFATAKRYIKFPIYMMPSGLLNAVSANMPIVILSTNFGLTYVGFYELVQRTLSAPSTFIGNSFGEVFRQQASDDIRKDGTCRPLIRKTIAKFFIVSALPFFGFWFYTPVLFEIIYGEDWLIAGEIAQLLVPMFYVRFLSMPVASIILLRNRPEIDFWWQLTFLALSLAGLAFRDSIYEAMSYFSIIFSFMYLVSFLINYKLAKV
jgi:O-antigen/teichoic acid export membrane protein